jgi:hypothetical protein
LVFIINTTLVFAENSSYNHYKLKTERDTKFRVPGLTEKKNRKILAVVPDGFEKILADSGADVRAFIDGKQLVFILRDTGAELARFKISSNKKGSFYSIITIIKLHNLTFLVYKIFVLDNNNSIFN